MPLHFSQISMLIQEIMNLDSSCLMKTLDNQIIGLPGYDDISWGDSAPCITILWHNLDGEGEKSSCLKASLQIRECSSWYGVLDRHLVIFQHLYV